MILNLTTKKRLLEFIVDVDVEDHKTGSELTIGIVGTSNNGHEPSKHEAVTNAKAALARLMDLIPEIGRELDDL